MACPFFMPDRRLHADWPFPHRLPLGAAWSGSCAAAQQHGTLTDQELKSCNLGYARDCHKLPAERSADALRFAVGEERDGFIHIRFSLEREYLPAGHGELLYHSASGRWTEPHANPCVQRMAQCYLDAQQARRAPAISMEDPIANQPAEATSG